MSAERREATHEADDRNEEADKYAQAQRSAKRFTIHLGIDAFAKLTSGERASFAQAWTPIFTVGFAPCISHTRQRRSMVSTITSYQIISNNLARSLEQTAKKTDVDRETSYYLAHIGDVKSIDDFLGDYRLYSYAMKAFGLSDMIYAKAFMRKVLTEGVSHSNSFANKLVDTRYRQFAATFDFADLGEYATEIPQAQSGVTSQYIRQALEEDAGNQNDGVRLALYFERKAPNIKNAYQILADKALLQVVQTALGISPTTAMADVDKQADMLNKRINFDDFQDPAKLKKFLQRFSVMWDVDNAQTSQSAPSIILSQPVETGINSSLLTTLMNLRIGR
ncbi:DUF1217 domain-containing protein [Microbacteriaceae bacterium K1510]|nr:DUF1217 domain-containing protein [Microbacteriaceae bacterium K1510]